MNSAAMTEYSTISPTGRWCQKTSASGATPSQIRNPRYHAERGLTASRRLCGGSCFIRLTKSLNRYGTPCQTPSREENAAPQKPTEKASDPTGPSVVPSHAAISATTVALLSSTPET